ncbi:hypothetical protein LTR91_026071 [Friedmanniomyces endolithicus]|uniref:BTB domain-containing protein n=1 Tax=Friedmanniomyces endolithicus TaxID=329885 RepID=A0AAN6JVD2_9PEZI|nr:hypothetical protein LTR91_026071 [Friedmanniomyces endolithicus]
MSTSYHQFLQSPPFRFLIGKDREEFFLHPHLVASHSRPLGALVNGSMHEAKERCALLDDTTPATFVRFGQYIYTGDYLAAEQVVILDSASIERDQDNRNDEPHEDPQITRLSDPTPRQPTPSTDEVAYQPAAIVDSLEEHPWDAFTRTSSEPKKEKKRGKLIEFNTGEAAVAETAESSTQRCDVAVHSLPLKKHELAWQSFVNTRYGSEDRIHTTTGRANTESCEEYTDVFLSHAQLYAFADRYDVEGLRELALYKLHQTLVNFTLFNERIRDVSELLCYSYDTTPERPGSLGRLRDLVIRYVACHIERFQRDPTLIMAMKRENSISVDLVDCLVQRLE